MNYANFLYEYSNEKCQLNNSFLFEDVSSSLQWFLYLIFMLPKYIKILLWKTYCRKSFTTISNETIILEP